ncbi:MAG: tyrosine--tRNA ligase [Candidatus Pacebacteria bacterium]|jgi:tyrosyl-tRNA synthetase|nr:tyrosine--tRNA ligase [Candidatus Paceibacterota bacterium]MBT3511915.1 tyrosine--tRNA ligase [Candidatus Paceibacterota bacterium]MBT4005237.1 tyrosine--tRNA ligase [Candidatus Paceibacterota bacterium]MBT4358957.1 tyrosine--tRNA ligase [Candidatus Paceibacterota bacterium]MBT4680478.1 tyrosine--tRNA ligase [Candidatus Paceibacterota bacterium]
MQNITIQEALTRGVTEILPSKKSLAELMEQKKIRLYLGIDPTGSLLTLGHSVLLRKLQQFADLDHDVILLIGGGTVKIGDPTGKDSTRPELTNEVIEENFKNWQEQASKILDFSKIKIMNNADWLDKLTYVDLIKIMAKTTVQQLMERDMFQERVKAGRPVHAHEIIYPLMQGYDSVHMDVDLEIGGTDQTFNMMMGRTLQKAYNNHEKWVLSTPIINGTDGRKMSKSYGNFVALTENPNDMYGKLMRIGDEMIINYFTVLTDVPMAEIEEMEKAMAAGENPMTFKKKLAFTITTMYHDEKLAQTAQENFKTISQEKGIPDQKPVHLISAASTTILSLATGARKELSSSDVRRRIEQGAVSIDSQKYTDPNQEITPKSGSILKTGKRDFHELKVED